MPDQVIFLLLFVCMTLGITIFTLFAGLIGYLFGTVLYNLVRMIAGLIKRGNKRNGKKSVFTS